MTANEKRAAALLDWMGDGDETHPAGDLLKRYAAALDAAERRGEDRVLRWIARFGGNYIPGGGFTSMIEAYRKARRRARGKA